MKSLLVSFIVGVTLSAIGLGQNEKNREENSMEVRLDEFEKRLRALENDRAPEESSPSNEPAYSDSTSDPSASSNQVDDSDSTVDVDELRRQLEILAEEVERLRSGEVQTEVTQQRARSLGLGPSAASVYGKTQGVSLAGYGEMVYENFDATDQAGDRVDKGSQLDFLRAILYAGYRFNDKFLFNSEIEFEHASTGESGSVSVEFAYLDYLLSDEWTVRAGLLLVPMGFINELHEPNVFLGALRPETERRIIPTTWRENGFGILGDFEKASFRIYGVNGLDAAGFSSDGLRGGRQKGSQAKASDFAFVARGDFTPTPGIFFGGSLYYGDSSQGQFSLNGRDFSVNTLIGEVHGQAQIKGWDLRGLYARASLDNARELNLVRGLTGQDSIAETLQGGYLQTGYNVLSGSSETMALTPYYRFESLNTQKEMPSGFTIDPRRDRFFHTFGLEFQPIYNIVIKTDYQWNRNEADQGVNQFNVALGYSF